MAVPLAALDAVRVDEPALEPYQFLVHGADSLCCTQEFLVEAFVPVNTSPACMTAMRCGGLYLSPFPLALLADTCRCKPQTWLRLRAAVPSLMYLRTSE